MAERMAYQALVSQKGARALREMYGREGDAMPPEEIARRLGCTAQTVRNLLTGKTYPDAGGPLFPELAGRRHEPRISDDDLIEALFDPVDVATLDDVLEDEESDNGLTDDEVHLIGGEDC